MPPSCTTASCVAATCNQADVLTALPASSNTNPTVIVTIPSGTCTWSLPIAYTIPSAITNLTIQGTGNLNCPGACDDQTVIIDNITRNASTCNPDPATLDITTGAASTIFRLTGFSYQKPSTAVTTCNGNFRFHGFSQNIRVDHVHITTAKNENSMRFLDWMYGVVDHNLIDQTGTAATFFVEMPLYGNTSQAEGDGAWADNTNAGTIKSLYLEDNIFNHGIYGDCQHGGKMVFRHNIMNFGAALQTHPTGGGGTNSRGCRSSEIYQNTFNGDPGCATNFSLCESNAEFMSSGTLFMFNNSCPVMPGGGGCGYQRLITLHSMRRNNGTYPEIANPNGWGFCGMDFWTGTVNTSSTAVTWVTGKQFAFSGGASVSLGTSDTLTINSTLATVQTFNSATSLTLATSVGTQTGVTYFVNSAWDGNTDSTGYPCLDQPGRGKGDLITGEVPNKVNSTTGTIAWPHQALEPVYEWLNVFTQVPNNPGGILSITEVGLQQNRDIYIYTQTSGDGITWTGPVFNGTVGTGSGSLPPSNASAYSGAPNCTAGPGGNTPGVAYWNTSNNTLYVCNPTNVWTPYYTPFVYPHPLVSGGGGTPAVGLSTTLINFGNQPVGTSSLPIGLSVTNTGTANLVLSSPQAILSGTNVNDYSFGTGANACTTNQTLAPSASCNIYIVFTPQLAATPRLATLSIFDNAANSPQTVSLAGSGIGNIVGVF